VKKKKKERKEISNKIPGLTASKWLGFGQIPSSTPGDCVLLQGKPLFCLQTEQMPD
jgi:hypothetical protein